MFEKLPSYLENVQSVTLGILTDRDWMLVILLGVLAILPRAFGTP
jgi:hypothetical protein